jgi:diaminopimelate epimerase
MRLPFVKYHGLGNDFALFDAREGTGPAAGVDFRGTLAVAVCDRHFGLGADGVLVLEGSAEQPRMTVVNADGSVPEMCGNGLRCFVKHVVDQLVPQADGLVVQTDAGPLVCTVARGPDGLVARVAVDMGRPSFAPVDVPLRAVGPWLAHALEIGDQTLHVTAVSTGNPHLVTFDADAMAARLDLAPKLALLPQLPHSANVEFAAVLAPGDDGGQRLELHVFERGCGWTLACGTGAVATVAAAVRLGLAASGREVQVKLPGGWLGVTVDETGAARMDGPAVAVVRGEIDLGAVAGEFGGEAPAKTGRP